jgi:hypothetical protein
MASDSFCDSLFYVTHSRSPIEAVTLDLSTYTAVLPLDIPSLRNQRRADGLR